MIWVNPEYYDKYVIPPDSGNAPDDVKPEAFNMFGTGASSSSSGPVPTAADTIDAREETRSNLASRIDKLFLEKSISENCAMCLKCFLKEQVGTIWSYQCGHPMEMQDKLPLTHAQILMMDQESSKKLLQTLGLRVRETDSIPPQRMRGPRRRPTSGDPNEVTFGGLTWAQRMRNWRKDAYKKKDDNGEYRYRWTHWPICERWRTEPAYKFSCNQMAQQYFGHDFD